METMRTGSWDLIWVLILSILCTNVTFYLSNLSLRHLSAFTSNIIYNLEPVYGIILGQCVYGYICALVCIVVCVCIHCSKIFVWVCVVYKYISACSPAIHPFVILLSYTPLIYTPHITYMLYTGGVVFKENKELSANFYIGTAVILCAVFIGKTCHAVYYVLYTIYYLLSYTCHAVLSYIHTLILLMAYTNRTCARPL